MLHLMQAHKDGLLQARAFYNKMPETYNKMPEATKHTIDQRP